MDEGKRVESGISGRTSDTIVSILKRLPSIWLDGHRARKLASRLPPCLDNVPLPDADTIYSWIKGFCATPHRRPGTPEGHRGEQWVAERFRELGFPDVHVDPVPITVWTASKWSLSVEGKEMPSFFVVNTGFTGAGGVSAPLVYVGTGTARDFKRVDVAGKIVVADIPFPKMPTGVLMKLIHACYTFSDPNHELHLRSTQYLNFVRQNFIGGSTAEDAPANDVYWQSFKRGAVGICLILRDQPGNSNTHYGPYDGLMKPMPGLWIANEDGAQLKTLARSGNAARLTLEGSSEPGVMHNVWVVLPGRSDEVILVTSHHDSPFQGAVEDGTGVAQVLAQCRAWSQVPLEQRPKTLVFVVDAGHFYGSLGGHTFARQHKDIMARTRILLTVEHLGGKEVAAVVGGGYAETGRLALTVMFTTPDPLVLATVARALEKKPARTTASIPANFFGPAPISDACGYVIEAGVPVISWIGCPYYLLDQYDTLDKVDTTALVPIAETIAEMIKIQMAMK
nr:M28 family peptidase [Candidatus Sigynarchaeota archaeon]